MKRQTPVGGTRRLAGNLSEIERTVAAIVFTVASVLVLVGFLSFVVYDFVQIIHRTWLSP